MNKRGKTKRYSINYELVYGKKIKSRPRMKLRKPKLMMNGHTNEMFTPDYAINPLLPYLDKSKVIWDCAYGEGHLAKHFRDLGFKVIGNTKLDFINDDYNFIECDIIITNPPYSIKDKFLERCYYWNKPFALLMPLTALEGQKRGKLYKENGIQLLIPNRRINFITPNKGKSSWFQTAWFCYRLDLPQDLMFVELKTGGVFTQAPQDKTEVQPPNK